MMAVATWVFVTMDLAIAVSPGSGIWAMALRDWIGELGCSLFSDL
jgi:hypothetical protein